MQICICGCLKHEHEFRKLIKVRNPKMATVCWGCGDKDKPQPLWYHEFKLDNLAYVEAVAKKKGLI